MDKIQKFKLDKSLDDNGEEQLSIIETLPKAISWLYNDEFYKIENDSKIIAVLLNDEKHIAIIESPFNKKLNKAYVVNGMGEIVMDISNLFMKKYSSAHHNKPIIFTDIYYINSILNFFLVSNNIDFRLKIDIKTKQILDLTESR